MIYGIEKQEFDEWIFINSNVNLYKLFIYPYQRSLTGKWYKPKRP